MKKKHLFFLGVSLFSTTLMSNQITQAQDNNTISIEHYDINTDPVGNTPMVINPNKPGSDLEALDESESQGSQGDGVQGFYINWVTPFNFGDVAITGNEIRQYAQKVTIKPKEGVRYDSSPFIQVTHKMTPSTPFKLTVKGSPLTNQEGQVIENASVTLGNAQVLKSDEQNQPTLVPEYKAANTNLLTGDEILVLSTPNANYQGVWSVLFENSGQPTSLFSVPKGASLRPGAYKTTLTWILKQEP